LTRKAKKKSVYPRLLAQIKPYWCAFTLGLLGSILFSGIDAYFSHFMKPLLDVGFVQRNTTFLRTLPFIILGLFTLRGVASFVAKYFMSMVGRDVVRNLRNKMFVQIIRLPASFHDLNTSGQLLSKIIYNVDQVASACTNAVTTAVQSIALIIGLFIVMFTINWRLTIFYIAVAPLVAVLIRYTGRRMRKLSGRVQNYLGEVSHISEEVIEGYKVVKIFGGEKYEAEKFAECNKQNRNQSMKIVATQSLSTMVVLLIGACVLALTVYLVTTSSAKAFGLTAGGFVAMIFAMMTMFKPMRDFSSVNNIIQQGIAGAESVFNLLDTPPEVDNGTVVLPAVKGEVENRNVPFKYFSQQDPD
jgi:subfamily B ATP-binding cassette protein MsbA